MSGLGSRFEGTWAALLQLLLLHAHQWMQASGLLSRSPVFSVCLCRAPSASGAQPGKRKLLAVSSNFRLPGDAVPAHMMFAANKAPRLGGEAKPTASGLSSQL